LYLYLFKQMFKRVMAQATRMENRTVRVPKDDNQPKILT
jgi:hypothetical protein